MITTALESKLPNVGVTIFTKMSALAAEEQAINLSQGFPDFEVASELIDRVHYYMKKGFNQYAPMTGMPQLREAIAKKIEICYGYKTDAINKITVTSGATEALFAAISAVVCKGDEVIVLEPAYDSYVPAIELNGGVPVFVKLNAEDFSPNWQKIRERITAKTKMIIINSPHNPTGSIFSENDLDELSEIVQEKNIFVLSDEVYEHIIFDGEKHQSILRHPILKENGMAVFSFGKTFHATGWKVGYIVAPEWISREIRKVHQYLTFSTHTPTQLALADYLQLESHYLSLPVFYQQKRDLFLELVKNSKFNPLPSKGTYFQLLSYKSFSNEKDVNMAEKLTKEFKVASIPISVFYHDREDNYFLRFCFAKNNETLKQAAEILCRI